MKQSHGEQAHMKAALALALLGVAWTTASAAPPAARPLGTIKTSCTGANRSTQDIKLYADGTVDSRESDDSETTNLRVTVNNNVVTMVQTLPYGSITRRFDMVAYQRYMKAHPSAAAADKRSYLTLLAMIKANCNSETHFKHEATRNSGR